MPVAKKKQPGRLSRAGVVLVRPDRIATPAGDRVVGRVGYGLLAALERGRASARQVKVRLWGLPEAPDNRLRQAVWKLNAKLALAGADVRVSVEDGDVVLV